MIHPGHRIGRRVEPQFDLVWLPQVLAHQSQPARPGHGDLKTTAVYARVLDSSSDRAVDVLAQVLDR